MIEVLAQATEASFSSQPHTSGNYRSRQGPRLLLECADRRNGIDSWYERRRSRWKELDALRMQSVVQSIIGMALAEAVAFYSLFLGLNNLLLNDRVSQPV